MVCLAFQRHNLDRVSYHFLLFSQQKQRHCKCIAGLVMMKNSRHAVVLGLEWCRLHPYLLTYVVSKLRCQHLCATLILSWQLCVSIQRYSFVEDLHPVFLTHSVLCTGNRFSIWSLWMGTTLAVCLQVDIPHTA